MTPVTLRHFQHRHAGTAPPLLLGLSARPAVSGTHLATAAYHHARHAEQTGRRPFPWTVQVRPIDSTHGRQYGCQGRDLRDIGKRSSVDHARPAPREA